MTDAPATCAVCGWKTAHGGAFAQAQAANHLEFMRNDPAHKKALKARKDSVKEPEPKCPHCGVEGIEHTPEDIRQFDEDMRLIELKRA